MIAGGLVELAIGVNAGRRSLEDVATLPSVGQTTGAPASGQERA